MPSTGTLRPTADGADDGVDWTNGSVNCATGDCYTEVDEVTADDDTTQIHWDKDVDTALARQSFEIDESSVPDGATIDSIQIDVRWRKQGGGGGGSLTPYVKVGGTNYDGALVTNTDALYQDDSEVITVGAVKAAVEIGVREGNTAKALVVTQISCIINYTEAANIPPELGPKEEQFDFISSPVLAKYARISAIHAAIRATVIIPGLLQTTLREQDRIYAGPGQAPMYDWPLPNFYFQRKPSEDNRTHLVSLVNTLLLSQDTIYHGLGQVPSYDNPLPVIIPRPTQVPVLSSLLVTILGVVVEEIPDGKQAFPALPVREKILPVDAYSHIVSLVNTILLGQDTIYTRPGEVPAYDWPLPVKAKKPSIDTLIHAVSLVNNTLLGQDTIYSDPGEVPAYHWPLPTKAKKSSIDILTHLISLVNTVLLDQDTVYGAPGEAPVYDWPLPVKARIPSRDALSHIVNLVNNTLLGQDTIYTEPGEVPVYQWPLPVKARHSSIDTLSHLISLVNITLQGQDIIYGDPGQAPAYDWQLPREFLERIPSVDVLTHLVSLVNTVLESQDTLYGDPGQVPVYIWPVPIGPERALQIPDYLSQLNTLLTVVIVGLPTGTTFPMDLPTRPRQRVVSIVIQPTLPLPLLPRGLRRTFVKPLRAFPRLRRVTRGRR